MLDLELVKKHLNIDSDFTEDDAYIQTLIDVAVQAVVKHIDVADITEHVEDGKLTPGLQHACLLLIGSLYANREALSITSMTELPLAYNYLLQLFQDYTIK